MPPKKDKKKDKKKDEEEIIGYDVAIMNTLELKQYARLLEKEIEEMRNYSSFYQKAEDKLGEFHRSRQEELKQKENSILTKDLEMENLCLKVEQEIREKRQWPKYNEFKTEERKTQQASEVSQRLEEGMRSHLEEQNRLTRILEGKERELEAESKKTQMLMKEALDKNSKKLKDVDEYEKALLAKSVKEFVAMLEDAHRTNRLALKSIETEALESKRKGLEEFRKSCESYKGKLHDYYKKITREDLDIIKELTLKTKELETVIKSTQLRLGDIQKQNEVLKASHRQFVERPKFVPNDWEVQQEIKLIEKSRNLKRIEKLEGENQDLQNKMKAINELIDNLRAQFTQALYKVRQSAELKVRFLENKLKRNRNTFVHNDEEVDSSSSGTDHSENNS